MGFFLFIKNPWGKSGKLAKLQKQIVSASNNFDTKKVDSLMNVYFGEICLKNEGIRNILTEYKLNKDDLYEIYINISAAGMGQWVKGHYIPLSTIAFNEPLLYVIESKKQDVPWMTILGDILDYWKGNIAQGTLFKKIKVL